MQRRLQTYAIGLIEFARCHGLRHDWNKPDNEGVTATIIGDHLDNAMGPKIIGSLLESGHHEYVIRLKGPKRDMDVNLADLLALATQASREILGDVPKAPDPAKAGCDDGWDDDPLLP